MWKFAIKVFLINWCMYPGIVAAPSSSSSQYDHSAYLDAEETYRLHWTVDRATKMIKFATEVKTTGYVGFGISEGLSGRMSNADIIIGWVDSNGEGHLQDMHGVGQQVPELDASANCKLTRYQESNGVTILQFERPLDTCDREHDHKIMDGTTKVIWSYSNSDPIKGDKSSFSYHIKRGARSLNLLNYVKNIAPPAGLKYFEILQPNISVPSADTTYFCRSFKIPDVGGRKHIIEIAPIIQKGNEGIVHHFVLFECASDFPEKHIDKQGHCETKEMPVELQKCASGSAAYAWAVGGTNFRFPDHVGLGVGGKGDMRYVVLETHYDNPQQIAGLRDSSGLRFYYTDKIRQYDAATLYINQILRYHVVPPKKEKWITTAYCPSDVTQPSGVMKSDFPNNAIKIFAAFPHAHLAGRALWLKHFKADGTEFPEIFRDDNYDFNFQQMNMLPDERTFNPGEAMNVYCRYNTMDRTDAIQGGIASRDEMCFFFLLYYPKQRNFSSCGSGHKEVRAEFFRKYAKKLPSKAYSWKGVAWNSSMEKELLTMESKKMLTTARGDINGNFYISDTPATEITRPFIPPPDTCPTSYGRNLSASLSITIVLMIKCFLILFL